ncbi:MAG: hypothetical protein HYY16_05000 [Planctomycetes bacterium]|nr:hypothetical protein [Planctomycetota bacterium]
MILWKHSLVAVFGLACFSAWIPQDGSTPKIGVVRLRDCFDEARCRRARDISADLKAYEGTLEEAVEKGELTRAESRTKFFARYKEVKSAFYQELCSEIEGIARDKGLDLILKVDPPVNGDSSDSFDEQIKARTVLYHSASQDITKRVLARLEKRAWKKKDE